MSTIIGSIQIAKKTKAAWELQNPTLMHGQFAAEVDGVKTRIKVGDGVTAYTALPYVTIGTTDDVTEGATNLYFTNTRADTRADARITASKNVNNGIAGLDSGGLIPAALLPSYVDDVLEYANLAAFPVSGVTGKMYVALDTNKVYRWSGSVYIEISASPGSTDAVTEGVTNLYFTTARVQTVGDARYSILAHTHTFASLTSKPTTLVGYGITDASLNTHTHAFADLTAKPTTISGYGITNIASGTYTPTTATSTNSSGYNGYLSHYIRIGNEVTVSINLDFNVTSGSNTLSTLQNIQIPIPSAMTIGNDLVGSGSFITTSGSVAVEFFANTSVGAAYMRFYSPFSGVTGTIKGTFTYTIK